MCKLLALFKNNLLARNVYLFYGLEQAVQGDARERAHERELSQKVHAPLGGFG
jgi:hypothetical protein